MSTQESEDVKHSAVIKDQRVEYQHDLHYQNNHWAVVDCQLDRADEYRVCVLWWRGEIPVIVKVNPTDVRGYRSIATAVNCIDPCRTFNRSPTVEENAALCAVLGLMKAIWDSQGLIGQISVAGNNSHSSPDGVRMLAGTQKEMTMIHGHVIARGPLGSEVVPGVPLLGPVPGAEFSLREGKVAHSKGSQLLLVHFLQTLIHSTLWKRLARDKFQLAYRMDT